MRALGQCLLRADELSVDGQLDALLAEDRGGRRLLLVEGADPRMFSRWAQARAAACFENTAYLDFGHESESSAVVATIGGAMVRTGPPNEQLRRLLHRHSVLLMGGMDDAFTRLPGTHSRWLAWCAKHLPLSLLSTADAAPYIAATSRYRLPMGMDRLVDPALASSAARLASCAMAIWKEAT